MEEWKEYKLKDFLLIPIRNGLTKPSAIRGKGVKMIGMKEIFAMDYIRSVDMDRVPVTDKEYESSEILKYDLLFARQSLSLEGAGKCGIVVSVDEPTVFESHLIRLRIDTKKANPFFIYYYYKSSIGKNQIKSLVQQVAAAGIRGKELIELGLKVPHIEKQNQIANILRAIDNKIEVNRRINDNLEQQAQALFKSWFVDFEPFRDQSFVESELGMIPQGWRVGSFLDNINVMPGGTPSTNVDEYWKDGTIPFFSPKDVNGVYCFETEKSITELGLNNCSSRLYPKDTLFITARGTVGKIALAGVPMAMNQSNYALAAKEGVGKFYLYLLTQTLVSTLLKKANGAVFSAITTKDFNEPNLIPANNVMDSFEVIVKPIFDKIFQTSEESRRLAELRDTLLPRLMSGEIKVGDVTL